MAQVVLCHSPRCETVFETRADATIDRLSRATALAASFSFSTMKPVTPSSMTSGTESDR